MRLSVSGQQVEVDGQLRDDIEQRLNASVGKYFERAIEAQVQFSREAHRIRADISVHAGSGIQLQSHAVHDEMGSAFDIAADRMDKRLRRYKRRLVHHDHRKPGPELQEVMAQQALARQAVLSGSEDDVLEDADGAPLTIAEATTPIHSLTVGEAVMRLEMDDHPVLMFRNSGHGELNVVYRRADGNIGWIDPRNSGTGK